MLHPLFSQGKEEGKGGERESYVVDKVGYQFYFAGKKKKGKLYDAFRLKRSCRHAANSLNPPEGGGEKGKEGWEEWGTSTLLSPRGKRKEKKEKAFGSTTDLTVRKGKEEGGSRKLGRECTIRDSCQRDFAFSLLYARSLGGEKGGGKEERGNFRPPFAAVSPAFSSLLSREKKKVRRTAHILMHKLPHTSFVLTSSFLPFKKGERKEKEERSEGQETWNLAARLRLILPLLL